MNSAQHSALLATGQFYRQHSGEHAVRVLGFVARGRLCRARSTCPGLSFERPTLCRVRRPDLWVAIRNSLSQHHPCKPCRDIKSSVAIGITQPWENSVATQGDPCRDPNTLSQPQTLLRHKIYVTRRGQKSLSRHRKPLSRPKPPSMLGNPIVTRRSLSKHRSIKLCHTRVPFVHTCLSRAPRPGRTLGLRTLSRHGRPCHYTVLEKPYRDINFSVATEDPK